MGSESGESEGFNDATDDSYSSDGYSCEGLLWRSIEPEDPCKWRTNYFEYEIEFMKEFGLTFRETSTPSFWVRNYCIMTPTHMVCYNSARAGEEPALRIPLSDCQVHDGVVIHSTMDTRSCIDFRIVVHGDHCTNGQPLQWRFRCYTWFDPGNAMDCHIMAGQAEKDDWVGALLDTTAKLSERSPWGQRLVRPLKPCFSNPVLRVVLLGIFDNGSVLSRLRLGTELVQMIYDYVQKGWMQHVVVPVGIGARRSATLRCELSEEGMLSPWSCRHGELSSAAKSLLLRTKAYRVAPLRGEPRDCVEIEFPEPSGVHIDMMPFVVGKMSSLPVEYQQYWPIVTRCVDFEAKPYIHSDQASVEAYLRRGRALRGRAECICYLTIHEGPRPISRAFSGPGVRTASPRVLKTRNKRPFKLQQQDYVDMHSSEICCAGGIYSASTLARKVWSVGICGPEIDPTVVEAEDETLKKTCATGSYLDIEGGCDHLVQIMDSQICWRCEGGILMNCDDRTPVEVPKLEKPQDVYFEVVTCSLAVWYKHRYTANPLGIVPDARTTVVLDRDPSEGERSFLPEFFQ